MGPRRTDTKNNQQKEEDFKMNKIQTNVAVLAVLAALGLVLGASPAHAVVTKNCPERIELRLGGFQSTPEVVDPEDKDAKAWMLAVNALDSHPDIDVTVRLGEKKSGRCLYRYRNVWVTLYTKNGKDLMMVQTTLVPSKEIYLRAYAELNDLNPREISIEEWNRFPVQAYFNGVPAPYYDGGPEVRPIGSASVVNVEVSRSK